MSRWTIDAVRENPVYTREDINDGFPGFDFTKEEADFVFPVKGEGGSIVGISYKAKTQEDGTYLLVETGKARYVTVEPG